MTLYLPQVDVDEVLRYAARRQSPGNLAKAGEHTLTCRVTDVGFIPIPGRSRRTCRRSSPSSFPRAS